MTVGLVYYSDGRGDQAILEGVRRQLLRCVSQKSIIAVTLAPLDFGRHHLMLTATRGYLTMFRQILTGLEALETDIAFLVEHDVLYHPSHFDFRPPRTDTYYYNLNVFKVDWATGRAVTYETKQTSGLCANRALLVTHYRERVRRVETEGFTRRMGFEPGSHRRKERVDDVPSDVWRSEYPNIDIRHSCNLTANRWSPSQFRTPPVGWTEVTEIPGWGQSVDIRNWVTTKENSHA